MLFTGISGTALLQAAAALGALVVVFYILKLKRRPIAVPFSPLWQRILRDKDATTLFSQLKRLLSLLLQLALLALMLLALGDPRPAVTVETGRHIVVLMDASASMGAIDVPQLPSGSVSNAPSGSVSNGPAGRPRTRLDEGREQLRQALRGLSGTDRMLIAQMDAAVTPLSTMTGEVSELEHALELVKSSDVRAEFAPALRFALDSLRGLPNPEILIVSDGSLGEAIDGHGALELGDVKLTYLPVGEGSRNVAITGFSVRRYPLDKSRYEVLLEIANTNDAPAAVDVELFGDGKLSDVVRLQLGAKETVSRTYRDLGGADRTLEARVKLIGMQDELPVDDHAFALLPERRRARVQVVTKGNMYLEAALLLDEYLEVVTVAPAAYPASGEFDVTIFDGVAPPRAKDSGDVLYLAPPTDEHTPFKLGRAVKSDKGMPLGFDELDDKHPIVRHLSLGEVNVSAARPLESTDKKDARVGKTLKGDTLLLAGRRKGHKFVALGFELEKSDLPLRIAWPLFLMNVIGDFVEEDASYLGSYRTGAVWNIP
ncbi:MAG: VWA domain-containing protein, partial [Myxococcales bacterium]|nr:VWA domain-containing protein [Myxococcales bacterium]